MRHYYEQLADHFADLSEWFGKIGDWYNVMSWRQSDAAYFRQIEGQMFEIAKIYRAMAQDEEKRENMRNTFLTSVMLVLALVFLLAVMPAGAQENPSPSPSPLRGEGNAAEIQPVVATVDGVPVEATLVAPDEQPPAPPVENQPPTETDGRLLQFIERIFPWLMAVLMTLLVIGGVLGREAIVQLAGSTPVIAREAAISAGESVLGRLETVAAQTEITLDDAAVAEFKKLFLDIVEEIRAGDKASPPKQAGTDESTAGSLNPPLGRADWRGDAPPDIEPFRRL